MRWAESKTIGGVSELTLLTPIRPGLIPGERWTYEQRLASEFKSLQRRVSEGILTPVGQIPSIHFARWVILRPRQYLQSVELPSLDIDTHYRSWLLFTSNFDGDMKSYLRDFAIFLGEDVDRIWSNCDGWPAQGSRDFEHFWDYAKRFQIPTNAFYAAYPWLSVPRIRQLEAFKHAFDAFVARTRGPDGRSVHDIASRFDEFLMQNSQYGSNFPTLGGTYRQVTDER